MSAAVRGAVPVVCNMLAGTLGVPVEWGQFPTASTNGKRVRMPNLPLEGKALARWAYGYIAHEAGHLRDTDFAVWPQGDPMLADILNILEDPRIERALCTEFPGARIFLTDLTEAMLEEGLLGFIDPGDELVRQVRKWLMYRSGYETMGYRCLEQLARQQDALLAQVVSAEDFAAMNEGVRDAAAAGSTSEVLAAARRIVDALRQAQPPQPEPEPEPDPQSQPPAEDKDQEPGTGQGQNPGDAPDQPDPGTQPAQPSQGGGEQPQSGDDAGQPAPVATPEQIAQLQQALSQVTDPAQWGQEPTDKGSMVEGQLGRLIAEAEQGTGGGGHGNSRMHMPKVLVDRQRRDGAPLLGKVRRESTAIRARLEDLVQDLTTTRHAASRSGRRLVRDAGVRMARGNLRMFDRRSKGLDVDAAVHLLLDVSLSMRHRLQTAIDATAAMCVSFAEVEDVDTAVSAFPDDVDGDLNGVRLVKAFDENYRHALGRLEALKPDGGTPLASALLHSQQMLLEHRRERRIAVVVTDGQPDNTFEALQVIRSGREAGIEYLGIGIGCDVRHLFDTFVLINDVQELPGCVIGLVRQALYERERERAA